MSDAGSNADLNHPVLNLTTEEKRAFSQLFQQADTENIGVVTGEVAVKFFERTKLAPSVLGEIWQIADTENRGLLTKPGFCVVLRLIGHYQAGREPTPELAFRPGPLPKFESLNLPTGAPAPVAPPPAALQPQASGGPIRVPPLTPDKVAEYSALFEKSGAQNGILPGETAKQIFEKARLPNEVLVRIWNLADTEQRGALGLTEFIIAMHLLASYKSRAMQALPTILPPGLYEAASRRGAPPSARQLGGSIAAPGIPRQFTGSGPIRTQSPLGRPSYGPPPQSPRPTGGDWLITPQEKIKYDSFFAKVDTAGLGVLTGEQAVKFFSDSGLPEDVLASIWDLADINSEGQLNRDEFAVAMYLIRQQRGRPAGQASLPAVLPPNLIPPSMHMQSRPVPQPTAPAFDNAANTSQLPKSASEDLFGLDAFSTPTPAPAPIQTQQFTGGSASSNKPFDADPFGSGKATSPTSAHFQPSPRNPASTFKPFMPTSAFGATLQSQHTGASVSSQPQTRGLQQSQVSNMDDLLGDNDPEVSRKLTAETAELANMSNQIGTLRNQMQEVQSKSSATEKELSQTSTQKRDLELRLSQFRSQYEQEVNRVKALEEQLTASRNDTEKLQQELAMIEGTYQDLQTQRRQVAGALEADQRENAGLKERIRQTNNEVAQLKPQLDKMRSDARQQKGMVAINKKQLATNEGEMEKLKGEMSDLTKAAEEQQRARSLQPTTESSSTIVSPAASTVSQSTNPFFRRSPLPPAESMMSPSGFNREPPPTQTQNNFDNLFGPSFASSQSSAPPQTSFRSEPHAPTFSEPSGQSVSSEGRPTPSASPPSSSYHELPRVTEPPVDPLSEIPAPPASRQATSNVVPVPRNDSLSSSAKTSAPTNGYGKRTGSDTPTTFGGSPSAATSHEQDTSRELEKIETAKPSIGNFTSALFGRGQTVSPVAKSASDASRPESRTEERSTVQDYGPPSVPVDSIPGAFPRDMASSTQPTSTGLGALSDRSKASTAPSQGFSSTRPDPFSMDREPQQDPSGSKTDFDDAFAGFGAVRHLPERQETEGSTVPRSAGSAGPGADNFSREFPPIKEFARDDDSDSESEHGFGDDFTASSPHKDVSAAQAQGQMSSTAARPTVSSNFFEHQPMAPQAESSASGQLPTPAAMESPPSYDQTTSDGPDHQNGSRESNQFPPEFGGLLPSREDPTSHPSSPQQLRSSDNPLSNSMSGGQTFLGGYTPSHGTSPFALNAFSASPEMSNTQAPAALADAYRSPITSLSTTGQQSAPEAQPLPKPQPSFNDDFDDFEDLDEAKEADDKGDNEFAFASQQRGAFDEFNPTFDSPAASMTNTLASQQTEMGRDNPTQDRFNDFQPTVSSPAQMYSSVKAPAQPQASTSHDWDAIFSGLDSPQTGNVSEGLGQNSSSRKSPFSNLGFDGSQSTAGTDQPLNSSTQTNEAQMPSLGRAITAGTEHDDPILKKLTSMGYPRSEALNALEKYDYDINKASRIVPSEQTKPAC